MNIYNDNLLNSNFNLAINKFENTSISISLNIVSFIIFYNTIYRVYDYLFDSLDYDSNIYNTQCSLAPVPVLIWDKTISDDVKLQVINKVSNNELFRSAILFYIFKIQGDFTVPCNIYHSAYYKNDLDLDNNIDLLDRLVTLNAYDEYKFWVNIMKGSDKFHLDETKTENTSYILNNVEYTGNFEHILFISWLYYSGIYQYLENPVNMKNVLDSMNCNKLLAGRMFLEYQLFLVAHEEQISEELNSDDLDNISENTDNNIENDDETDNDHNSDDNSDDNSDIDYKKMKNRTNNSMDLPAFHNDFMHESYYILRGLCKVIYNCVINTDRSEHINIYSEDN